MSNHLAIATVTAGLRQTLSAAVGSAVPGAAVTTSLPDAPTQSQPDPRVNLFLYQVTPNAAGRNADLPARNATGTLMQRTNVALDLHYLLTFYGDETQLEPQRLLGAVVRTLHSQPVLSRPIIQSTITSPTFAFLATSDLGSASEPVRFAPASLALEELSKLWSVFLQTPYRLSIAYQGTMVCIEPDDSPSPALPVRARNLYAVPFRQPVIERVLSQAAPGQPVQEQPILPGFILVLTGQRLSGASVLVQVADVMLTPAPDQLQDSEIRVPLPPTLRAGVQAVQVVQQQLMGTPPTPHRGVESNATAFVLHPTVTATAAHVSSRTVDGVNVATSDVTATFTPSVGNRQRVFLLLSEFNAPSSRAPRAYSFPAPPRSADTNTIVVRATDVVPGDYLLRVQVDGAESPLAADVNGVYVSPRVTVA